MLNGMVCFLFYWMPVLVWEMMIHTLSAVPGRSWPAMPSESAHFWAHRAAHFAEYFLLGLLLMRAWWRQFGPQSIRTVLLLSLVIFLSGVLDEWHQTFVPGREGKFLDAFFDLVCGTWGLYLFYKIAGHSNQ